MRRITYELKPVTMWRLTMKWQEGDSNSAPAARHLIAEMSDPEEGRRIIADRILADSRRFPAFTIEPLVESTDGSFGSTIIEHPAVPFDGLNRASAAQQYQGYSRVVTHSDDDQAMIDANTPEALRPRQAMSPELMAATIAKFDATTPPAAPRYGPDHQSGLTTGALPRAVLDGRPHEVYADLNSVRVVPRHIITEMDGPTLDQGGLHYGIGAEQPWPCGQQPWPKEDDGA